MVALAAMTRAQKAATLVLAMGPRAAGVVLAHLSNTEVERIAQEVVALDEVPRDDVLEVVRELLESIARRQASLTGGATGLRQVLGDTGRHAAVVDRVLGDESAGRFGFLLDHSPAAVGAALAQEQRQTAAVVMAHLPAGFAGKVLKEFPEADRHDLAMRVATLPAIPNDVVRRLEAALLGRIGEPDGSSVASNRGGEREVATVLNSLAREDADAIMEAIRAENSALADRIRDQMFVFEDIVLLESRSVQEVLRTVEPTSLATAMAGAPTEVTDVIWGNLSERASTALEEELELVGKPRRADVEEARLGVVRNIRELVEAGTVTIDRGHDDA